MKIEERRKEQRKQHRGRTLLSLIHVVRPNCRRQNNMVKIRFGPRNQQSLIVLKIAEAKRCTLVDPPRADELVHLDALELVAVVLCPLLLLLLLLRIIRQSTRSTSLKLLCLFLLLLL